jgi:hypothetical protein
LKIGPETVIRVLARLIELKVITPPEPDADDACGTSRSTRMESGTPFSSCARTLNRTGFAPGSHPWKDRARYVEQEIPAGVA